MTYNLHVCAICCGPEVDNDVIPGEAVDTVGVAVHIKFGDFRSNGFRDIREDDFMSNEPTNKIAEAYPNSAKRDRASPINE